MFPVFGLTRRKFVSGVHLYENLLSGCQMVESQYVLLSSVEKFLHDILTET